MRCTSCDYPLWNTASRTCPECGSDFRPSQFEYAPNNVRFCCPHCDQAYFGTNERGHLDPFAFDCVSCGKAIDMDRTIVRPVEGVDEQRARADVMPWFERRRRGWLRAWVATIGMSLVQPHRLMRAIPVESSTGRAWAYASVTISCFLVLSVFSLFVLIAAIDVVSSQGNDAGKILLAGVITLVMAMIASQGALLAWCVTTHLVLVLTGGATHPLRRTCHALCYGAGANVTSAIPCIGTYPLGFIGTLWWIVSGVFMLREAQSVSGGRAAIAVLTMPVISFLVLIGGYGALLYTIMMSPALFGMRIPAQVETAFVAEAVIAHAETHDGAAPRHATLLVTEGDLAAANFVSSISGRDATAIPVADATLDEFEMLPPNRQSIAAQAAIDALPPDVIAHRLGDFVFTAHGIDIIDPPDPGLWILVLSVPAPATAASPSASALIAAALPDGTVVSIQGGDIEEVLAAQNELRRMHGLAPLPDPWTITHEEPPR